MAIAGSSSIRRLEDVAVVMDLHELAPVGWRPVRGRVSLVQLAAPSRLHLKRSRDHLDELVHFAEQINARFATDGWKPIHLLVEHHDAGTVHAFLSMATIAIVSSLHDGMNLVAKEYVLAQDGLAGCLILSEFAGAARQLTDALVINPTTPSSSPMRSGIARRGDFAVSAGAQGGGHDRIHHGRGRRIARASVRGQ